MLKGKVGIIFGSADQLRRCEIHSLEQTIQERQQELEPARLPPASIHYCNIAIATFTPLPEKSQHFQGTVGLAANRLCENLFGESLT
jgi:hypothetical protein